MTTGEATQQGMQAKAVIVGRDALPGLLELLQRDYGTVYGPVRRNRGAVFSAISSFQDLALDYGSTVLSPKKFLLPPMEALFSVRLQKGFEAEQVIPAEKQAIFGVHSCDLSAIALLDKVYQGSYVDPYYAARREATLVVALTCGAPPHGNCFCASMGTGPSPMEGYDLLLTDLGREYLLEAGSPRGAAVVGSLGWADAAEDVLARKKELVESCISRMPKAVDTANIRQMLNDSFGHPHWAKLKEKCLGCGNCALSCPSCYCYNVIDRVSLDATHLGRARTWDACLLLEFAEVHGGNFRKERDARIKQFVYHKLSYWVDQHGTFGCVGCGRCIAACPAKIDITQTVGEIRG